MPQAILDPTGQQTATAEEMKYAHRRTDLRGATVGLLETPKRNADVFLKNVGELLVEHYGAAKVLTRRKVAIAQPASGEIIDEFVRECDVVVTGVGDCGSCSASAVADGVKLEGRGIPAAVIVSDAFTVTSDAMAELQSAPGYKYVTTPHPVASLDADQIAERARAVLGEVTALLVEPAEQG